MGIIMMTMMKMTTGGNKGEIVVLRVKMRVNILL